MLTACSDNPHKVKMCGIFHDLDHCRLLATDGVVALQYNTPHILSSEKGKSLRPSITTEMKLHEALFKYNKSLKQYECIDSTQRFPNVDAVKPNIDDCFKIEINGADKMVKEIDAFFKKRATRKPRVVTYGRTYFDWAKFRKVLKFMLLSGEEITFYFNEDPIKQSSFVSGDFYALVMPIVIHPLVDYDVFNLFYFPSKKTYSHAMVSNTPKSEIRKPKKEVKRTPKEGKASTKICKNVSASARKDESTKARANVITRNLKPNLKPKLKKIWQQKQKQNPVPKHQLQKQRRLIKKLSEWRS